MQSKLLNFADQPESPESNQPTTATSTGGPMFAGELPADILDDVARHMTGAFDYILFKVTEEGVTLKPYVEEDGENTLSQAVTIPVSDWDTFELTDEIGYVCAVDPYTGLYKAMTGTDASDTVTVEITPCENSTETWEILQDHRLFEPVPDGEDRAPGVIDALTIGGTETLVLRNPAREELDVASLNYHSFTNIDSAYEMKNWLAQAGTTSDDALILVSLTTGNRSREPEYLLTFTEIDADEWEPVGDSLHLSTNTSGLSDETDDLSDITIGGTRSRPEPKVEKCMPDGHDGAVQASWGFYRLDKLNGMFKHLLKDTLTEGKFTFEMSCGFPIQITHPVTSAVESDTDATVTNMLAPVVSPS